MDAAETTAKADTAETTAKAPAKAPSFEELMAEVERITQQLERGDLPLEAALVAFERASALARDARGLLESAEARLTRLVEGPNGTLEEVPFDLGNGADTSGSER